MLPLQVFVRFDSIDVGEMPALLHFPAFNAAPLEQTEVAGLETDDEVRSFGDVHDNDLNDFTFK